MKYFVAFVFAAVVSLAFSGTAYALEPFNDDAPPDPCGAIDANRPCYAAGAATACKKGIGYDACVKYCECVYQQNLKKCGYNVTCRDFAASEKNACLGHCITDWS